ncbi:mercuric resistance operon regulatory protein [Rhodobiaceae bacterium]|nr:mercuric resistance operon regulatory protein [Rhodobiaceae bacterium]
MTTADITRGQLAKRTGCNAETIRYYEKTGIMPDPRRVVSVYRYYDEKHVRRLHFVMQSRELGFSIEEIRSLLDLVDRRAVSCGEVEKLGKAHLHMVRKKISDLEQMADVLDRTVSACSGEDVPECPLIETLFSELA